jgi:DNA (cytosine-5)-methyltransferase 1
VRYGSVCSGIEAASIAWGPLRWSPAWFSEIDAFPSAVLAHHWPEVPNLGDMLALPARVDAGEVEAPDVLVGGTPCQAFSVAGNRESLSDARGNLTLTYVELADAIDRQRIARGEQPAIIVWENVPGVLSTKDNAFGCFLAGLAGEDVPLLPPGKRWTNAGLVLGPKRAVAWRILDAQYFGVAQRRRRVFVVASARNGFDPSQILFEFDGLRRDSAPRRETGQEATGNAGPGFEVAGTLDSRVKGGGFPGSDGAMGGHVVPSQKWPADVASTLNAAFGSKLGLEDQHINSGAPLFVPSVVSVTGQITHALNTANNGKGSSEDGTGRGVPTIAFSSKDYGADASDDLSPTLRAGGHADSHANAGVPPAITVPILEAGARTGKSTTDPRAGIGIGSDGDPMFTLQAGKQHAVAAQTVALRGRDGGATAELGGEVATALRASSGGGDKPHVLAPEVMPLNTQIVTRGGALGRNTGFGLGSETDPGFTLQAGHSHGVFDGPRLAVRRLTPEECEVLQAFPRGHTDVPYRGKRAADGPRYRAIGNSMCCNVMHWIGQRIAAHLA